MPLLPDSNVITQENNRWLIAHGRLEANENRVELEVRCNHLTEKGSCGIYDSRPLPCMLYKAGGKDCLEVVKQRRSPEDYQRIRDVGDPATL